MAVDTSVYERSRRQVNDQYAANRSANAYSRFLSQRRGSRQVADFNRQFKRQTPQFVSGYARRGLTGPGARSGVYNQALQRWATDHQRGHNDLLSDYAAEQRMFDMNDARFDQERQRALLDIEADKQREIALAALNIKQLRPLIGG